MKFFQWVLIMSICNSLLCSQPTIINSIKEINQYDLILIDLYGVVYDGTKLINKDLPILIEDLCNKGKTVVFLSNAPRPVYYTNNQLKSLKIPTNLTHVLTSGELVREQLKNPTDKVFTKLGKKYYYIGGAMNNNLVSNLESDFKRTSDIKNADFILLTKTLSETESIDDLLPMLKIALSKNIPIICSNPDITVLVRGKIKYTAGFIANKYSELGGKVYHYGKPHKEIFQHVISKFNIPKNKTIMIGDSLNTDIKGAHNSSIDSLLVLSGNYGHLNSDNINDASKLLENNDYKPTFIMQELK